MYLRKNFRIIYIAGYGRSGSTLLDIILGESPFIFSMGEVSYVFSEIVKDRFCSCGEKITHCPIWNQALNYSSENLNFPQVISIQNKLIRNHESLSGLFLKKSWKEYQRIWESIFSKLSNLTESNVLVDSSKVTRATLFRIQALKRMGYDVSLIHLVRHPLSVAKSVAKGSNQAIQYSDPSFNKFGGANRGVLGWLLSNWATEKFCYPMVDRKIRVRYEDLVSFPSETLSEISEACQINLKKSLENIESNDLFPSGHGIAGNRMRFQAEGVRLVRGSMWKIHQSYQINPLLLSTIKPFIKKYGY